MIGIYLVFHSFSSIKKSESDRVKTEEDRKAAEAGDASAQFNFAWRHESGKGVPQDYRKAVEWFRKASDRGSEHAESNLQTLRKHLEQSENSQEDSPPKLFHPH
jgi:TPR repeat protein